MPSWTATLGTGFSDQTDLGTVSSGRRSPNRGRVMWKLVLFLGVTFSVLAAPTASELAEESAKWILGSWLGVLEGRGEKTRSMEITEIVIAADGSVTARAVYGITGEKMSPIKIAIDRREDTGIRLSFETPARPPSVIKLSRVTDWRFVGTFEREKLPARSIRFWKTESQPVGIDPQPLSFLGRWEGIWTNGLEVRLEVTHLDSTGASVRYSWGNLETVRDPWGQTVVLNPPIREGWIRHNATISKGVLEFVRLDREHTFSFELTRNGRYVSGRLSGPNTDFFGQRMTIMMNRIKIDKK